MRDGPDISRIAALIGDPARASMIEALMDGRALTASELANVAGVTKQTASAHIARLEAGGVFARAAQGRHRYFRLADADVAQAVEALTVVAQRGAGTRTRTGPKDPALRLARVCYDHLAGERGVAMYDAMTSKGWIEQHGDTLKVTARGWPKLAEIGVERQARPASRRPLCRACLDWSMRRHHLAGRAGKDVLDRIFALGWARREPNSRVIRFSVVGETAFQRWLS